MTRTGRSPRLGQHIAEPFAEIHPADAEARGIGPADLVEVTSPHGRALVRALVTDRVQPGSDLRPDALVRRVRLAGPRRRPGARPRPTRTPASPRSRPAAPRCAATPPPGTASPSAAAARRPATDYWAIAPTPFGWRAELADAARPDDWAALARSLFAAPDAEAVCRRGPRPRHRPGRAGRGRPHHRRALRRCRAGRGRPRPRRRRLRDRRPADAPRRPSRRGAGGPRRHRLRLLRRRHQHHRRRDRPRRGDERRGDRRRPARPAPTAAPAARS